MTETEMRAMFDLLTEANVSLARAEIADGFGDSAAAAAARRAARLALRTLSGLAGAVAAGEEVSRDAA